MNSPVRLLFGSVIGAGVGVALSKIVERRQEPGLSASLTMNGGGEDVHEGEDFKDRLARAGAAGADARARKEAELRELFRAKVHRSDALIETTSDV